MSMPCLSAVVAFSCGSFQGCQPWMSTSLVDVVCAHVAVLLWVMCVHVCISIPAGDVSNGEAVCPHIVCGFGVLYQ